MNHFLKIVICLFVVLVPSCLSPDVPEDFDDKQGWDPDHVIWDGLLDDEKH